MKKLILLISVFFGLFLSVSANSSPPLAPMSDNEEVNISNDLNPVMPSVNFEATNLVLTASNASCLNLELSFVSMELLNSSPPSLWVNSEISTESANYNMQITCNRCFLRPDESLVIIKPVSSNYDFMCVINRIAAESCLNNLKNPLGYSPQGYQVLRE